MPSLCQQRLWSTACRGEICFPASSGRGQPAGDRGAANGGDEALHVERLVEEPVGAAADALAPHLARGVGAGHKDLRRGEVALHVVEDTEPGVGRVEGRRQVKVEDGDVRLVDGRAADGRREVVGRHHLELVAQRPEELLRDRDIVVNYENLRLRHHLLLPSHSPKWPRRCLLSSTSITLPADARFQALTCTALLQRWCQALPEPEKANFLPKTHPRPSTKDLACKHE